MVSAGRDKVGVTLDVLGVSELTVHSNAAAQPLSDTQTNKESSLPLPFLTALKTLQTRRLSHSITIVTCCKGMQV